MPTISNEYLQIGVKEMGAELCSLVTLIDNREYIWQGDDTYWGRQAPILFPAIGCSRDGKYTYDGKDYEMPKHGFARDLIFDLVSQDELSLVFKLNENNNTLKMFPFRFELIVSYELKEEYLRVSYNVINKDAHEMYFSIGGHPAFNIDIEEGDKYLEFGKQESLKSKSINLDNGLIEYGIRDIPLINKRVLLSNELFKNDALVFEGLESNTVALIDGKYKIKMTFEGFPYLGVWSKPGPFVCLEPWYGIADFVDTKGILEKKRGTQSLKSKEIFSCYYDIAIEINYFEDKENVDKYIEMSSEYDGGELVEIFNDYIASRNKNYISKKLEKIYWELY